MILPFLLTSLAVTTTTAPATQSIVVPVAAVWHDLSPAPGRTEYHKLLVGVWSDGTIVWSEDAKAGGKPYRFARVQPEQVAKLLKDLDALGFFSDAKVNHHRNQYPPDASYIAVAASWQDKRQRLASWRDPPESGNDRFKEVFIAARKRITEMTPAQGEPLEKLDENVYRLGRQPRGG